MRKLLISLIMIAALGAGGAFAQTGYWAGVSGGYPTAQVHFGVENVLAGLDVRGNLSFGYFGFLEVGASVLYDLGLDTGDVPINVYVGGGPSVGLAFAGAFVATVELLAGAEYRLSDVGLPQGGVFLELGPAYRYVGVAGFGFGGFGANGRLGFNWHF